MPVVMDEGAFDRLVEEAIESLPGDVMRLLDNCVLVVEDEPPDGDSPDLLGYYDGIPLTERDSSYGGVVPDRIVIFRGPTLRMCASHAEVVKEVRITVAHEIAHYFGIDDDRLHDLGYG